MASSTLLDPRPRMERRTRTRTTTKYRAEQEKSFRETGRTFLLPKSLLVYALEPCNKNANCIQASALVCCLSHHLRLRMQYNDLLNQRTICRRDCHEREKVICIHTRGLRPLAAAGGASRCYAGKISAQHPSLRRVAGRRGSHEGCRDGMEGASGRAASGPGLHQHRACRAERPVPLPRLGGLPRKISESPASHLPRTGARADARGVYTLIRSGYSISPTVARRQALTHFSGIASGI